MIFGYPAKKLRIPILGTPTHPDGGCQQAESSRPFLDDKAVLTLSNGCLQLQSGGYYRTISVHEGGSYRGSAEGFMTLGHLPFLQVQCIYNTHLI